MPISITTTKKYVDGSNIQWYSNIKFKRFLLLHDPRGVQTRSAPLYSCVIVYNVYIVFIRISDVCILAPCLRRTTQHIVLLGRLPTVFSSTTDASSRVFFEPIDVRTYIRYNIICACTLTPVRVYTGGAVVRASKRRAAAAAAVSRCSRLRGCAGGRKSPGWTGQMAFRLRYEHRRSLVSSRRPQIDVSSSAGARDVYDTIYATNARHENLVFAATFGGGVRVFCTRVYSRCKIFGL